MPTVEMWRRILLRIPTLFGRVVYLASLFDAGTGRYRHEALEELLGAEECDRTLNRCHHRLFSEWLTHGLEEQKSDLSAYLRTVEGYKHFREYENLVPPNARKVERQLFLTDIETLMELLR
jgi:hypothetical protein